MSAAINNNDVQTEINDDEKSSNTASMDIDLSSEVIHKQLAELDARKPPRSGYMLFASTHRKDLGQCGAVSGVYINNLFVFIFIIFIFHTLCFIFFLCLL